MNNATPQPGAESSEPFYFSCQRSGNCCRIGHGRVWIDATDLPTYAALTATSVAAFTSMNVVQVGQRLSLRERADGRCILLEGHNACTIYQHRPSQCRSFPYWPEILADPQALERAARYCPGVQRFPQPELAAAVLPQVARIFDALLVRQQAQQQQAAGQIPQQPDVGREEGSIRFANSLEIDLLLATGIDRHLRIPSLLAELGQSLQHLADASGYPWSSATWDRLLHDREVGWSQRGGPPALP